MIEVLTLFLNGGISSIEYLFQKHSSLHSQKYYPYMEMMYIAGNTRIVFHMADFCLH